MCLKKRKASVIMKSTTRSPTRKLQSVYEREREGETGRKKKIQTEPRILLLRKKLARS